MNASSGGAVDPESLVLRSVGNVIGAILFGERLCGVDAEFDALARAILIDIIPCNNVLSFLFPRRAACSHSSRRSPLVLSLLLYSYL